MKRKFKLLYNNSCWHWVTMTTYTSRNWLRAPCGLAPGRLTSRNGPGKTISLTLNRDEIRKVLVDGRVPHSDCDRLCKSCASFISREINFSSEETAHVT